MESPKAFISYSWSSPQHRDLIRSYAERLVSDGIDVTLDQWNLSEGHDKYAFMEGMVLDSHITHVLIFSDKQYTEKANERKAGVGTESQIISQEIYNKVKQEKFIPIVCQMQEEGDPYLPVFLKSRIWLDFSTPENVNANWERLLRVLYGKPIYEKPTLGKPPSFLLDDTRPSLPTIGKYNSLREALLSNKPSTEYHRKDFIGTVIAYADSLRIHENINIENADEKVISDFRDLLPLRDQLIDWFSLESNTLQIENFDAMIIKFLERILVLKYKPEEVTQYQNWWYDAPSLFVYELFLYFIAVLIKENKFLSLQNIFSTQYLLPDTEQRPNDFVTYNEFWAHSSVLEHRNQRLKLNRINIIADFIKERATRKDISFQEIMQAELVIFLISLVSNGRAWYPHTLTYAERGKFPFFIRLAQHKFFEQFKIVTGIASADVLRQKFSDGCERHKINSWQITFHMPFLSIPNVMNVAKWDTI